ncbi:DEAD/DEAH box helicase family protein, partial [Carnobacterium sp.]|uniref:DEAD/DEAH box helicase n=1 Tax=Carnobacterium sp. TaxID=48221 RepID=UPI0028B08A87
MSYFSDRYSLMKVPIANDSKNLVGLRNAQVGAVHALGAYFTTKSEPVLVSMPTGTGKTAVIMMAPYLLQASKVLIITPTVLVRSQISNNFSQLEVLKRLGVFAKNIKTPQVFELKKKFTSDFSNRVKNADVVISTPGCALSLSESTELASSFDMVVIDEAHHEPAKTWRQVLVNMPESKHIL